MKNVPNLLLAAAAVCTILSFIDDHTALMDLLSEAPFLSIALICLVAWSVLNFIEHRKRFEQLNERLEALEERVGERDESKTSGLL